jgi:hypothetical protein
MLNIRTPCTEVEENELETFEEYMELVNPDKEPLFH